jgi:hypothetical protein
MYWTFRAQLVWGIVGCLLIGVSGCTIGPSALRGSRPEYNRVIQQTEKQELLLNIVRLRYGEHIKFLQVSSIVASWSMGASASGGLTIPFGPPEQAAGVPATSAIGGGLNYSETPTITYVPVEGQQFANQILSPLSTNNLQALLQSGWFIDRIMALAVDRMGPLVNNPAAPTYSQFNQLIKIWRQIQDRGDLFFVWYPSDDWVLAEKIPHSAVDLRIFNSSSQAQYLNYKKSPDGNYQLVQSTNSVVMELHYANQEEADQVSKLLGSVSMRPKGELVERVVFNSAVNMPNYYTNAGPVTQILMNLRSFSDMLFSLLPGVAVPPEDTAVALPADPRGMTLITVQQSNTLPDKAFVAVPYRGRWFAIADTDRKSKANFMLLLTILSLQTTGGGAAPGLTLPIGR